MLHKKELGSGISPSFCKADNFTKSLTYDVSVQNKIRNVQISK